jgi:hypothetical protein
MDASTLVDLALSWFTTQIALLALHAPLGVAAALLLVIALLVRRRRQRALRDELSRLKGRIDALEASEYRRVMQTLNRRPLDVNMSGLLTPPEDGTMFPIAPKMVPSEIAAQEGAKPGGTDRPPDTPAPPIASNHARPNGHRSFSASSRNASGTERDISRATDP